VSSVSIELLDGLNARATSRKYPDMGFPETGFPGREPPRPTRLSDEELEEAERRLGFRLPAALSTVYQQVGNGGFGPGYGLIGIVGGMAGDGHDVTEDYELRRQPDPDDPGWTWPEGLLAICHWGCAIYSCIDCRSGADPEVIRFDPNPVDDDWSMAFFSEERRLSEWLAAWLDGADLWEDGFRNSPFKDDPDRSAQ
jgi:hypothetical protein